MTRHARTSCVSARALAPTLRPSSRARPFDDEIETIRRVRDEVHSVADRFVVLLALNRKPSRSKSVADDYERFSVTSEYFSDAELTELTKGFEAIGCAVDVSDGEKEFNERLVRGDFDRYARLHRVVYHSTGSGTGRCRTAFMPALCRLYHLSDSSNDTYTSTIAENKVHFFNLLAFYGFPIPQTWFFDSKRGWLAGRPAHDIELIAKPAYECASIGVSEASVSRLDDAFFRHIERLSESMSQPVLVQEFIEGYEVEVPLFDIGEPFTPMSIGVKMNGVSNTDRHFLTYDQVYDDRYGFYSFCRRMPTEGALVRKVARDSFTTLGLRGMIRVDFRIGKSGRGVIIDYNNAPHLTEFHSCARAVVDLGFEYSDMLCLLLYEHVRHRERAG
jgi:D-alanine-D-alanine ligase